MLCQKSDNHYMIWYLIKLTINIKITLAGKKVPYWYTRHRLLPEEPCSSLPSTSDPGITLETCHTGTSHAAYLTDDAIHHISWISTTPTLRKRAFYRIYMRKEGRCGFCEKLRPTTYHASHLISPYFVQGRHIMSIALPGHGPVGESEWRDEETTPKLEDCRF